MIQPLLDFISVISIQPKNMCKTFQVIKDQLMTTLSRKHLNFSNFIM